MICFLYLEYKKMEWQKLIRILSRGYHYIFACGRKKHSWSLSRALYTCERKTRLRRKRNWHSCCLHFNNNNCNRILRNVCFLVKLDCPCESSCRCDSESCHGIAYSCVVSGAALMSKFSVAGVVLILHKSKTMWSRPRTDSRS